MQTPLLWLVPWEKNISPPHSFFQIFSSFRSEQVSWRKQIFVLKSFKNEKILLLLIWSRIPRTLSDKISNFTGVCIVNKELQLVVYDIDNKRKKKKNNNNNNNQLQELTLFLAYSPTLSSVFQFCCKCSLLVFKDSPDHLIH